MGRLLRTSLPRLVVRFQTTASEFHIFMVGIGDHRFLYKFSKVA